MGKKNCTVTAAGILAATTFTVLAQPTTISVPVSVTKNNAAVQGLTATDFRLFEDGVEQRIEGVSAGPGPVSVAIVLDTHDGTAGVGQEIAQRAIEQLAAALTPEDQIAVITNEGKTVVSVPWTSPAEFPRPDRSRWRTTLTSDLLQGVYLALGLMNEARHPRAAVVAITDALQVGTRHPLRDLVRSRRESEAGIYGLRMGGLLDGPAGIGGPRPGAMGSTNWESREALISFDDLVRESGGKVMPARILTEADRSAAALISELRQQYVLTFRPTKALDGSYRKLKVAVRSGSPNVRVRAGYRASVN